MQFKKMRITRELFVPNVLFSCLQLNKFTDYSNWVVSAKLLRIIDWRSCANLRPHSRSWNCVTYWFGTDKSCKSFLVNFSVIFALICC